MLTISSKVVNISRLQPRNLFKVLEKVQCDVEKRKRKKGHKRKDIYKGKWVCTCN